MPEPSSRPLAEDLAEAAQRVCASIFSESLPYRSATPSVSDLSYRGLRGWGLAQVRLKRMAPRLPSPAVQSLLAIGWAALEEKLRPDHVVVDETVKAAKQLAGGHDALAVGRFVNALMRQTLKWPDAAGQDRLNSQAIHNAPPWWEKKIRSDHPKVADQILSAITLRPPLTVRVAAGPSAVPDFLAALSAAGLAGVVVGPCAVVVEPAVPVDRIPWFLQGGVSVQDAAAQWATRAFDELVLNSPPQASPDARSHALPKAASGALHILDVCAAPGGKAMGLAQNYAATIWAMDISATRLQRLEKDLPRVAPTLKGVIRPVVADGLLPDQWPADLRDRLFDAILIDAPCSASGVCRRHPEIPWRRTAADIAHLVHVQRQLLDLHWRRLKPGGYLVFVTCSIFPEEGPLQKKLFLQRTPDAVSLDFHGQILPQRQIDAGIDQDGFYYAKFRKHA